MTDLTDRRFGTQSNLGCKSPVVAAATTNITLSGEQTIDGVAVVDGDRVLVAGQTAGANNGIYVASTGAWTRAADFSSNRDAVSGTLVPANGSVYKIYRLTTANPITIGTTSLTFQDLAVSLTPVTVATDAIWNAAGDLAVGTGADTAARLAIGSTGQVLTVAAGTAAWSAAATGTPGGSTTQVQFNDASAFAGDAGFTWDKTNNILTVGTTTTPGIITGAAGSGAEAGQGITVRAGAGGATSGAGGNAGLVAGAGTAANSSGGDAEVTGGAAGSGTGAGGDVILKVGAGGAQRGNVVLNGLGEALATTATGGFTMLPTCAGTPTGVPAVIPTGTVPMVFDTTGVKLWIYTGAAWKGVVVA